MECSCISVSVEEYDTILSESEPRARKQHMCHECNPIIQAGEKYRMEATAFEGSVTTHKTCLDCISIRDNLLCDWFWTMVRESVRDGIMDWNGEVSETAIANLTPAAREWVCGEIERIWED